MEKVYLIVSKNYSTGVGVRTEEVSRERLVHSMSGIHPSWNTWADKAKVGEYLATVPVVVVRIK